MNRQIKGTVMSIENGFAIVLTPDGQFLKSKLPDEACFIGDEIAFGGKTGFDWSALLSWREAVLRKPVLQGSLAAVMLLTTGLTSWAYPAGHVYMEVNPSIGITYNVFHRVIGLESFNEDGEQIKQAVDVYGKSIEEGIKASLMAMDDKGFVKENSSGLILGFSEENKAIHQSAMDAVGTVVEKVEKPLNVASLTVDQKSSKRASNMGTSPINVAIVEAKTTEKVSDKQVKTDVAELNQQTTAQIIESNPQAVKKVQDGRLEQIKKNIERKKQQLREFDQKLKEIKEFNQKLKELNREQQKIKQQQSPVGTNQASDETINTINQDVAAKGSEQMPKAAVKQNVKQAVKQPLRQVVKQPITQSDKPAAAQTTNTVEEQSNTADLEENPADEDEKMMLVPVDQVPGKTIDEQIKWLRKHLSKLYELRQKAMNLNDRPLEKQTRIEAINYRIKQIEQLLQNLQPGNKPEKAKKKG